ncbi:DUF982 domain-containing protein [Sinorhizobium sp. BG8]|uniref:DUF982 domain-containing protein n=1 Tax=Sinorhizobium sp. BG8 TaxID=2613773 RepID=UPI00193C87BF|nr:DUF982 domain-containing protein [Sinorhizobium sp. BG8]
MRVEIKNGKYRMIHGPVEALECLTREWPVRDGPYFDAAKKSCEAAIARAKPASEARDIFISASLEAFLRVH